MDFSPLYISLKTAGLATVITFILGIYAARFICKLKKYQGFIDGIITLPLVLPPTVVGFFLLLFLGKNSFIGQFLASEVRRKARRRSGRLRRSIQYWARKQEKDLLIGSKSFYAPAWERRVELLSR